MARNYDRWFQEQQGVACRFAPGLLATGVVPGGAQALLIGEGRSAALLPSGTAIDSEAILFRAREITVPLVVEDLRDRDGTPGTLKANLFVEPPMTRTAMLLLRDAFLKDRDHLEAEHLAPYFAQRVRPGLLRVLVERPWDGEGGFEPRLRKGEFLPALLKEPLFDVGLSLLSVLDVEIESESLEERRARKSELRREAERVRERLEFIDLWKREEMGEALARDEVERLAKHLEREGTLRELEKRRELTRKQLEAEKGEAQARGQLRRMLERERIATQMEIDEQRLEFEIDKAKRLKVVLEEAGLLGAIGGVADPLAKERLIELLIEKEMTPEQISARSRERHGEDLDRRFAAFADQLRAELRGGRIPDWVGGLPPMRRIWLAAGLALYRIDADEAFAGGDPTPVLPPEDIGHLRSVTVAENGSSCSVLVGAQVGVAVYDPHGSHWALHRYRHAPRGRGGVNAVVKVGSNLLATHSEMGFHLWRAGDAAPSRSLFADRIVPGISTRGACLGPDRRVYFSHGRDVYSVGADHPESALSHHGTLSESVTALGSRGDVLIAGTRDGRLHRFEGGESWKTFPFETRGPIFRIMAPGDAPEAGWVVGARECAVHVLGPDGNLIADYRSRYPIRWTAAGRQGVLGVDRFGQHLVLWNWSDTRSPLRRIRVPDQIQYLAVERGTV